MSRFRMDRRAAMRQRLLITALLGSLAAGAFLLLHLIAASEARSPDGAQVRDRPAAQEAVARRPGEGIRPTWPVLAGYLTLTGAFVAVCCRGRGPSSRSSSMGPATPSGADEAQESRCGQGAGGLSR